MAVLLIVVQCWVSVCQVSGGWRAAAQAGHQGSLVSRSDPFPLPNPSINTNRQPRRQPSSPKRAPSAAPGQRPPTCHRRRLRFGACTHPTRRGQWPPSARSRSRPWVFWALQAHGCRSHSAHISSARQRFATSYPLRYIQTLIAVGAGLRDSVALRQMASRAIPRPLDRHARRPFPQ